MARAAAAGAGIVVRGGAAKGDPSREASFTEEARRTPTPGRVYGESILRMRLWQDARLDDLLPAGMSRMEFTLRYTCSNPDVATTVVATTSLDHMRENVEAVSQGPLPLDIYEEARRRLSAAAVSSQESVGARRPE
jgi:aryl-alcohol dehydrogenase-like predicted oxidoreductase